MKMQITIALPNKSNVVDYYLHENFGYTRTTETPTYTFEADEVDVGIIIEKLGQLNVQFELVATNDVTYKRATFDANGFSTYTLPLRDGIIKFHYSDILVAIASEDRNSEDFKEMFEMLNEEDKKLYI